MRYRITNNFHIPISIKTDTIPSGDCTEVDEIDGGIRTMERAGYITIHKVNPMIKSSSAASAPMEKIVYPNTPVEDDFIIFGEGDDCDLEDD